MLFFSIIMLLIIALGMIKLENSIINPISMLYILWALILYLASLELFGLFHVSDKIYRMIVLGLVSFGVGYIIIRAFTSTWRKRKQIDSNSKDQLSDKYEIRYRLVYLLCTITILYHLKELSVVLQYLLSGNSLAYIRAMAQDSTSTIHANKSGLENALKILIVTPLTGALQPVVATDFFNGKRNKILFFLNVIILSLRVITDGSRTYVIYFAICLIISFFFANKKRENLLTNSLKISKKKQYIIFSFLIVVIMYFIYLVTASRSGDNIVTFAYYYFSMQPIMFEKWANIVDLQNIYGYGIAATNGFSFAFHYIMSNFFGIPYPEFWRSIYNLIEGTGTDWQTITAQGTSANSFVSAFWVFYLDGRELGVYFGMFIYGILTAVSFSTAKYTKNLKSLSIYSIIYLGLFYTFVRLQFANVFYAMTFLYVFFVMYKRKRGTK
ncbi:O-antigen polymerase [Enterococcus casseliflavus]|uniref:O-antigen polymerase n=1 Tax=Enterococcus casseliflavus TaxID=37734 RepID=UPI003D114887